MQINSSLQQTTQILLTIVTRSFSATSAIMLILPFLESARLFGRILKGEEVLEASSFGFFSVSGGVVFAVGFLMFWLLVDHFIYRRLFRHRIPYTIFSFNLKADVTLFGYLFLLLFGGIAGQIFSGEGLELPLYAYIGLMIFAWSVYLLEYLIFRSIELLFQPSERTLGYRFWCGFYWTNIIIFTARLLRIDRLQ